MKLKRNLKTNIVERYNSYHNIVNVKSSKKFIKDHGALEHGLGKCLEIFFDKKFQGGSKKKELNIHEIVNGKKLAKPFTIS